MNRCKGCGLEIKGDKTLCERCFRIRNYGDYRVVIKDNEEFVNLINEVNDTNSLVILVMDLFNLNPNIDILSKIKNNILLVLTKRDILPKSLYEEKLLNYFKSNLNIVDKIIISSNKNYHFDELVEKINKYKNNNKVYVMGYTNAGKSSMINKLLRDYTENTLDITTSFLPNTTLNNIEIKVDENLTLIDTPGIIDKGSIYYYLDAEKLKKIIPKKPIKPRTFQIRSKQSIICDDFFKLDLKNNNITVFLNNSLEIRRVYNTKNTNLNHTRISVARNEDLVISGLCFIKFTKNEIVDLYTLKDVFVYTRKSLI